MGAFVIRICLRCLQLGRPDFFLNFWTTDIEEFISIAQFIATSQVLG